MTRSLLIVASLVAVCSCNPTKPGGNVTQRGLTISGTLSLAALGQTSQLTAFATFSDGSRTAVTGSVTWAVQDSSVATITSDGLLRATGFGSTTVSATQQAFSASETVQVSLLTSGFAIGGPVVLSAIGQTSQLKGTATLSDGTTQDVTSKTIWSVDIPTVASVSATGLLTVTGLGLATITAKYTPPPPAASLTRTTSVVATPPGMFAVQGRTRDPGQGNGQGNLSGVSIVAQPSGQSTTSVVTPEGSNNFFFGGLTDGVLSFTKSGYEPVLLDTSTVSMNPSQPSKLFDVPMQQIQRFPAGTSVSRTIAPVDVKYPQADGSICFPCQLVRVVAPSDGTLHLVVTWTDTHVVLAMWVNGVRVSGSSPGPSSVTADVAVSAGDVLVYVGQQNNTTSFNFVTFTLTTAMK